MWCERPPSIIYQRAKCEWRGVWTGGSTEYWLVGEKSAQRKEGSKEKRGGRKGGEVEGMQERDERGGGVGGWWGGRRWSTGKPLRMAVLPDTGSDWERKRETREDWRRERERTRERSTSPHPPPHPHSIPLHPSPHHPNQYDHVKT